MKKTFFMTIIIIFMVTLFCEVKEVMNPSRPDVPNRALKLEKSYELDEDMDSIQNFIITNGHIYFVNMQVKSFTILDLEGNIIKYLDQTGRGPGEFSLPTNLFNDEKNSRIGVVDQMNQRTSYFDYDGNYIEDVLFEQMQVPLEIQYFDGKKFFAYIGFDIDQAKGSILSKPTIELIDDDSVKTIYSESFNPLAMNIGESKVPIFAINEQNIFITHNSIDKYQIQVFDLNGEHLMNITKKFKKIKKSNEDIKEIENTLNEMTKQVKASGAEVDLDYSGYEYENSIASLMIGPKGNLWVRTTDQDGNFFDIIGDDGKIIGRYRKKNEDFGNCKFYKSKLYEISGNEDEGFVLNVYSLKD